MIWTFLHCDRLLPAEIFLIIMELLNYADDINDVANDVNVYAGSHDSIVKCQG